jgi:siroheme synthase (precorrin-2 oxidase/ferrochelatase)
MEAPPAQPRWLRSAPSFVVLIAASIVVVGCGKIAELAAFRIGK